MLKAMGLTIISIPADKCSSRGVNKIRTFGGVTNGIADGCWEWLSGRAPGFCFRGVASHQACSRKQFTMHASIPFSKALPKWKTN